ncbi:MAG: LLM class flavin-dependent oxidoreductase [Deltaproteobacteria bacterium]|nr:LLM class flavin-dependent oxidoreductase [Deltaproteobacteria bacterium]MBW2417874.1 LLM class flavin-dependent oxidoreductase [Deltaproteobacteria bacterium]
MKIGVCLPYNKPEIDRKTTLDWCRAIEAGPFSAITCGERITGPSQEMNVLLSAAAALTERVRIVPSLYVLPMHSAVWAAKQIATLDVLSGGRVTVTVGVGGREVDYRAVGASFARRHPRMDEQIAEMRRIWAGEPPFEGADPVGPLPVQKGGPPILAGAMGPKAIARASRWAQGIYAFTMNGDTAPVEQWYRLAEEAWQEAGRSERPQRVTGFWYSLADDADARLKKYVYDYLKVLGEGAAKAVSSSMSLSTPDAVRAALDAIEELGCDELYLVPATADLCEMERVVELLESR